MSTSPWNSVLRTEISEWSLNANQSISGFPKKAAVNLRRFNI
jgi:hypothetical protein